MARGYRTIKVSLSKGATVNVYTSPKLADALQNIAGDLDMYHGVKLFQILEAVYNQGMKDGRDEVFQGLKKEVAQLEKALPHKRPGRPRKSTSKR
jgi:hypothetical protein